MKLVLDSMAGYALAKLEFPGKSVIFMLILATLMVPFAAMLIPLYSGRATSACSTRYRALILPPLANPLGVFLMRQFILALPKDLENAARLEGVSEFGIYWRIILPLVKPGLVVLAVLIFPVQFMSFVWPLVATSSDEMLVITTGLATQRAKGGSTTGSGRRRGDGAGPDRGLLLAPAAPVPRRLAGRSAEAMSAQPMTQAAASPHCDRAGGRDEALRQR